MVRVTWTNNFIKEFEEICLYLDEIFPRYRRKFIDRINGNLELLESFPKMGRIVPERNDPNIRELIVGSYRLIYILEKENIILISLFHSKRDFSRKL